MSEYRFDQIAINSTEKKKPEESDKYTYIGLEHLDSMDLEVHRWGSEVAPKGEKLLMKKGDVLFGKRRAYQKKVAIAPFDGIFSAHGMVLRPNEKIVDKDFFPLFISSDYFLDAAIKISVGSLSPTINWRDLRELKFCLPDLETQRKLAKVLWAINATMQNYKVLLAKTDELVKSQFIELFGDPFCNEHWNCKPLDQIFSMIGRGKQPKYVENSNIRVINQACIYWDGIKYENVKFHDSTSKKAKLTLEPGDVLINSTGTGTLGRAQVFDIGADEIEYITDSHVTVLRGTEKILPQFFQMILSLPETQSRIYADCVNGSTNQIELSKEKLCALEVITPDIVLQKQFVDFIKQSDKSKFGKEMCDKWILEIQNSWYQMYRILHQ
jgi:type I restriction enzyme S subunit